MSYRLTLKKIRESKGISQTAAAKGVLTQSTYSKFENGKIEANSEALIKILENLDISLEELLYINNGYKYSEKESIYRNFYRAPVNDINTLREIKYDCEQFLYKEQDQFVSIIYKICVSLIISIEQGNIAYAISNCKPILEIFEKKGNLFIKDIYLINSLFFLFPIETAHITMKYVDEALKKYGNFRSINQISVNLHLNYCLMLIKNKDFETALLYLKEILPNTKKHKLGVQMGITYIRMGICYKSLNCPTDVDYIKKGFNILDALEEDAIIKLMENEISKNISEL